MMDEITDVVVTARPDKPDDELTLLVDGQEISGWEETEVTLRAEGFPPSFGVRLSTRDPGTRMDTSARAGDACVVLLGRDVVITGYIDRDVGGGDASSRGLQIVGRGKTQDLVDCAAEYPGDMIIDCDARDIAELLCEPYGIIVELGDGADAGGKVPQWCLSYGETAAAIIQRVAQNAGLLAYETPAGLLTLAAIGTTVAAGGIAYGRNVEAWSVEHSMDGRYSEIVCRSQSLIAWGDVTAGAGVTGGGEYFHKEFDPNVPRHRQLNLILEQVAEDPIAFTKRKAVWEVARRAGRAAIVRVRVSGWRDADGRLWLPNTLVDVALPGHRGEAQLVIAEATFRRNDKEGTVADLVLMSRAAFVPQPISLQPINASDVVGPPAGGSVQ